MTSATRIVAFAVHQRAAPLDARERLLERVAAWRGQGDRVVLATCHRVEVYAVTDEPCAAREWMARELVDGAGEEFWPALSFFEGVDATRHLFEVGAGLDSAVQGEAQIASQVRTVLASAPWGLDPILRRLLERALHVARSLRRGSGLGRASRSVGSLAVDEIVSLMADAGRSRVLVVGAGEMGKLAARALVRRVGTVVVANRDRARAEAVAAQAGAEPIGLEAVPAALRDADGVVSAADTRGTVLTSAVLEPRLAARPLVLIDIAVPRSVPADARSLPGLVYRSVDDLDGALLLSSAELTDALQACAREAERFVREIAERLASDAIREIRGQAEALRRTQLDRALRHLGHLSERDRRVVETLSSQVTSAVLHAPTLALKEEPSRSGAARALFGTGPRAR